MSKMPMTPEGYNAIKAEIRHLKTVARPQIIQAIAEARAHGDLSENAEYHAAKERQSFCETRLRELENIMARAEIIDPVKLSGNHVMFGATVTLVDEETEIPVTYQILGETEADAKQGKISISSPVARALIAKEVGATIEVTTPGGARNYEIIKIEYI